MRGNPRADLSSNFFGFPVDYICFSKLEVTPALPGKYVPARLARSISEIPSEARVIVFRWNKHFNLEAIVARSINKPVIDKYKVEAIASLLDWRFEFTCAFRKSRWSNIKSETRLISWYMGSFPAQKSYVPLSAVRNSPSTNWVTISAWSTRHLYFWRHVPSLLPTGLNPIFDYVCFTFNRISIIYLHLRASWYSGDRNDILHFTDFDPVACIRIRATKFIGWWNAPLMLNWITHRGSPNLTVFHAAQRAAGHHSIRIDLRHIAWGARVVVHFIAGK